MSGADQLSEVEGGEIDAPSALFPRLERNLELRPLNPAAIVAYQPHDHLAELVHRAETAALETTNGRKEHTGLCWTYAQLHRAAVNIAAGLLANSVASGATIMTFILNSVEAYLFFYLSILMKLTLVPLDLGALSNLRTEELQNHLRRIKPDVIVVPDAAGARAVENALASVSTAAPILRIQLDGKTLADASWKHILDVHQDGQAKPIDEEILVEQARHDDLERICMILFTSGTSSGKPKGCPRSVRSMARDTNSDDFMGGFSASSRVLLTTSFFRVIAPTVTLYSWRAGATVITASPLFDPRAILQAAEMYRPTMVMLIPAMLHALTAEATFTERDTRSIAVIGTGGDVITRDIMAKMSNSFPSAEVSVQHGMTEGGNMVRWPYYGKSIDEVRFFGEVAPLGYVQPGTKLKVWDKDHNALARRGDPGELHVCSDTIIRQYFENAHEDAFYEDEHGRWYRTGDMAMITEGGLVYILGRDGDVIKRAGLKILPAALESSITQFTNANTSVVAMRSVMLGQEPFAVLEDFNGHTVDEIKQHVIDLFGKEYALAGAVTLKGLGLQTFPLNATDKIMKIELQKEVERYLEPRQQ